MIISDRHRYLFVELPRTGSTAVHRELCALYEGEPILAKHATYGDFLKIATDDQKRYFVFSSVRDPLDDAVSKYFKVRGGRAAGARPRGSRQRPQGTHRRKDRLINRLVDTHMTRFVRRTDADFATFFLRYYVLPYDTWASLAHRRFEFVVRFETLAEDFEKVLRLLGVEPRRPLPTRISHLRVRLSLLPLCSEDSRPSAPRTWPVHGELSLSLPGGVGHIRTDHSGPARVSALQLRRLSLLALPAVGTVRRKPRATYIADVRDEAETLSTGRLSGEQPCER